MSVSWQVSTVSLVWKGTKTIWSRWFIVILRWLWHSAACSSGVVTFSILLKDTSTNRLQRSQIGSSTFLPSTGHTRYRLSHRCPICLYTHVSCFSFFLYHSIRTLTLPWPSWNGLKMLPQFICIYISSTSTAKKPSEEFLIVYRMANTFTRRTLQRMQQIKFPKCQPFCKLHLW